MPERRRLGTGGNTTRSGLTAHWATQRQKSSAHPATEGGYIIALSYITIVAYIFPHKSPLCGGPKNGEQATPAAVAVCIPTWPATSTEISYRFSKRSH